MMEEVEACEYAFDQFIKNNESFLVLQSKGFIDLSYEMILLEVCATFFLLEPESRQQFFEDIEKIKNTISAEVFEDESDFLDCISQTMEEIRDRQ